MSSDITARIEAGENATDAVEHALSIIKRKRTEYLGTRKRHDRSNRIVENILIGLRDLDNNLIDVSALDRACVPEWVTELRQAAKRLTQLAAHLERGAR